MSLHLERQLAKVRHLIAILGERVEELVKAAVYAVESGDKGEAVRTIARDTSIDNLEVDVEEECLHTLALYQPVAMDLRYIVAVLKMNNDLERIADQAVSIAEEASYLADEAEIDMSGYRLEEMESKVLKMLADAIESVMRADPQLAESIRAADGEVDVLDRRIYDRVIADLKRDPDCATQYVHVLTIARQLERIADLTINIAEDVIYMARGDILRHVGNGSDFDSL
ncbi:MAG: phosphate signaling complex protein PhoU [Phycisphaera sp.]|nr:phosphate signaling complex protein PhoU [Phycisphaera sp.]